MESVSIAGKFKYLARMGYTARGLLYLVIGGLALMLVFSPGGETVGSRGAVATIKQQPFGNLLLALTIVGLIGYAAWRTVQSIKDTDNHSTSVRGLAIRAGLMISALTHTALAVWALTLLLGDSSSSGGSGSGFLSGPVGIAVTLLVGITLAVAGVAHIIKGYKAGYEKYVELPSGQRAWMRPVCRFGLAARGVVWLIVAWFFINAAWHGSQQQSAGIAEALNSLREAPFGPWLFAVTAAGLFAFGIYSLIEARYRRISLSSGPP